MKTLKESLQNLIDQFLVPCIISDRCTSGYSLTFHHVLPTSCLDKLIALSNLYGYSYYLSSGLNSGDIVFNIYRVRES